MNKDDLLKKMRDSVGNKEPIEFFSQMTDLLNLLFDKIDSLENELKQVRIQSALAIEWEPKVAAEMLSSQIEVLRKDKMVYHNEISSLKKAVMENLVTQDYRTFCDFWITTLGWHPFLNYAK